MQNRIHPTAYIDTSVEMGSDNQVGPYAVILGPCTLGDGNWIGPHASIGTPAQIRGDAHPAWNEPNGIGVIIGDRNTIREYATIHQGSEQLTRVGSDGYFMAGSHIPHDANIGNAVTLANAVQIGGHTTIGRGANLGLGVNVHQRTALGPGVMVGMNATVTKDLPPFALAVGSPARVRGANRIGLERAGVEAAAIDALDSHYRAGMTELTDSMLSELGEAFLSMISSQD